MTILKISKQDILRQLPVEPNWYNVTVKSVEMIASKDKQSVNAKTGFELENGRILYTNFNSKAMGMAIPFVEAVMNKKIESEDFEFDTDKLIGKQLQIKVINGTYEGRVTNDIADYLPLGATRTEEF